MAVVGVALARRDARRGALLVLVPGTVSAAWIAFIGPVRARGPALLRVPLLPIGGWMMWREVPKESPLPTLPEA